MQVILTNTTVTGSRRCADWSFINFLSKNYVDRDSSGHHFTKPCYLHKATLSSLPLPSVKVSNWSSQNIGSIWEKKFKRMQKGRGASNCHEGRMASLTSHISPNVIRLCLDSWILSIFVPFSKFYIWFSYPKGFCEAGRIVLGTELQSASLSLYCKEWQNA